jgi:hypothetical protein
MTLDEAIKHCLDVAEKNETTALRIGQQYEGTLLDRDAKECRRCAADHRQLAEWLTELKEAKRLLKLVVEDCKEMLPYTCSCNSCALSKDDGHECFHSSLHCADKCKWRYADEALKLIGGSENE